MIRFCIVVAPGRWEAIRSLFKAHAKIAQPMTKSGGSRAGLRWARWSPRGKGNVTIS